jgi:signal transduction histidine kinase
VPTELTVAGPVRALTIEADESLYRAAQEGLTNVRKNHITNVLAKLNARDRTQAALRARALGLL